MPDKYSNLCRCPELRSAGDRFDEFCVPGRACGVPGGRQRVVGGPRRGVAAPPGGQRLPAVPAGRHAVAAHDPGLCRAGGAVPGLVPDTGSRLAADRPAGSRSVQTVARGLPGPGRSDPVRLDGQRRADRGVRVPPVLRTNRAGRADRGRAALRATVVAVHPAGLRHRRVRPVPHGPCPVTQGPGRNAFS